MADFLFEVDIEQRDQTVDTITVDVTNVASRSEARTELDAFVAQYADTKYRRGTQAIRRTTVRDRNTRG